MSIQKFNDLFQWADQLAEVMRQRKRNDLVQQIQEAKAALESNVFTLAVLGKAKRGKSTLINVLLGRSDDLLAPIDKLPASSAITRFRHAEQEQATILFRDNRREGVPYSRIREFVTEEFNPENKKEVAVVEVEGPFKELESQIELVDTPGAGSIHEHHNALLHAFIPQADAVIFIVTARMPLDQDELDLLKKVKAADIGKVFFVLNKVDESDEQDIEDAVKHNQQLLAQHGINIASFHRVSAKQAFQGKPEDSGVLELMDEIARFLAVGKGRLLRERFLSRVCGIVESELRSVEIALSSASKTGDELDEEINALRQRKQTLQSERKFNEREFERKWTDAVNDFSGKLSSVQSRVLADVNDKIVKTSSFGVGALTKGLPTFLNRSLEDALLPLARDFEASTRTACLELDAAYPAVGLDDMGKITVRAKGNTTFAAGSVAGVATAAGGVGLVTAAGTTAASIAAANAAAMATSTMASTALLTIGGAADVFLGLGGLGTAAGTLGSSMMAPTLVATPLWVALAGPIGWTMAGVGVLAVPFAWRLSKLKQKDKLENAAQEQVREVFRQFREERIPALRKMGTSILDGFRNRLDRQLDELEHSLISARDHQPSPAELTSIQSQADTLRSLIEESVKWFEQEGAVR